LGALDSSLDLLVDGFGLSLAEGPHSEQDPDMLLKLFLNLGRRLQENRGAALLVSISAHLDEAHLLEPVDSGLDDFNQTGMQVWNHIFLIQILNCLVQLTHNLLLLQYQVFAAQLLNCEKYHDVRIDIRLHHLTEKAQKRVCLLRLVEHQLVLFLIKSENTLSGEEVESFEHLLGFVFVVVEVLVFENVGQFACSAEQIVNFEASSVLAVPEVSLDDVGYDTFKDEDRAELH